MQLMTEALAQPGVQGLSSETEAQPWTIDILGVTGGRRYIPGPEEYMWFVRGLVHLRARVLVHGAAKGVDAWAAELMPALGLVAVPIHADWDGWERVGHRRRAGGSRSWQVCMAAQGLFAFPGGIGTQNAVRIAKRLGLPYAYSPGVSVEQRRACGDPPEFCGTLNLS